MERIQYNPILASLVQTQGASTLFMTSIENQISLKRKKNWEKEQKQVSHSTKLNSLVEKKSTEKTIQIVT